MDIGFGNKRQLLPGSSIYTGAYLFGRLQFIAWLTLGSLMSGGVLDPEIWRQFVFLSLTLEQLAADFALQTLCLTRKLSPAPSGGEWSSLRLIPTLPLLLDAHAPSPASRPRRILIVEDIVLNQVVAKRMLEKLGFEAEAAGDGLVALGRLERESFDLVLMDCQMPVMDGYETTQAIRRSRSVRWPEIPIIAFTANSVRDQRARCLESGMDDYVNKPIELQELNLVLNRWMGERPLKRRAYPQQG